jgi:hypothetical protein
MVFLPAFKMILSLKPGVWIYRLPLIPDFKIKFCAICGIGIANTGDNFIFTH